MPGPNFRKMYNRFKKKKNARKKVQPRKRIDKQQNKQIMSLKRQVKKLTSVREPQRIKIVHDAVSVNGTNVPTVYRITQHDLFIEKEGNISNIPEKEYRQGDQITIGNINCHLTLFDLNNSFRWRVMAIQFKERPDLTRTLGEDSDYVINDEMDDLLRWYDGPSNTSSIERLNWNLISPLHLKKDHKHTSYVLFDKIITGKNRTLKLDGVDNEIRTVNFTVKPKMRKLTFENGNDDSPYKGDIIFIIYNDYPFSGSRGNGFSGTDQVQFPQKYKTFQLNCEYNVYDE